MLQNVVTHAENRRGRNPPGVEEKPSEKAQRRAVLYYLSSRWKRRTTETDMHRRDSGSPERPRGATLGELPDTSRAIDFIASFRAVPQENVSGSSRTELQNKTRIALQNELARPRVAGRRAAEACLLS
jgi:hypothetical protein